MLERGGVIIPSETSCPGFVLASVTAFDDG